VAVDAVEETTLPVSAYDSLMLPWLEFWGSGSLEELSHWMLFNLGIAPSESERWLRAAYGRGLIEAAPDRFKSEPEFADLPRWRLTDVGRELRRGTSDALKLLPPPMTARLLGSAAEGFGLAVKAAVAAAPLVLYGWLTGLLEEPSWQQGLAVAAVAFGTPAILYARQRWRRRQMPWVMEVRNEKRRLKNQGKPPWLAFSVVQRRQILAQRDLLQRRLEKMPSDSPERRDLEETLASEEQKLERFSASLDRELAKAPSSVFARAFGARRR
jgi:hypothetical protein